MKTWIIGKGGLLGSALARQVTDPFKGSRIPWTDPEGSRRILHADLDRFAESCRDGAWQLLWVAGRAVTSSDARDTIPELELFEHFCTTLSRGRPQGPGAVFLASSAGAAYAGSADPPFDERTPAFARSAYGHLKLGQEQAARDLLTGVRVVIGRIANLYGPGQDLSKAQGLITRLASAAVTREPINLYVSLDTLRDYVFVDDAAGTILDWMTVPLSNASSDSRSVRVVASGSAVSVGQLVRLTQTIARRRIPIALGTDTSANAQSADLRLIPSQHPQVRPTNTTPLAVGIKAVIDDLLARRQGAVRLASRG